MKKLEDISTVGVIIARVQTPYLHAGHKALFDHVSKKHPNVIVFLGIPRIQNTKRNPLDFSTRKEMIQHFYPNLTILLWGIGLHETNPLAWDKATWDGTS